MGLCLSSPSNSCLYFVLCLTHGNNEQAFCPESIISFLLCARRRCKRKYKQLSLGIFARYNVVDAFSLLVPPPLQSNLLLNLLLKRANQPDAFFRRQDSSFRNSGCQSVYEPDCPLGKRVC